MTLTISRSTLSTREARCRPELSAIVNDNDIVRNMHSKYNFTFTVYAVSYLVEYAVTLALYNDIKSFADYASQNTTSTISSMI